MKYGSWPGSCLELFPQYDPGTASTIVLFGYGLGVLIGAPITGEVTRYLVAHEAGVIS